jgi:hypothetical protein
LAGYGGSQRRTVPRQAEAGPRCLTGLCHCHGNLSPIPPRTPQLIAAIHHGQGRGCATSCSLWEQTGRCRPPREGLAAYVPKVGDRWTYGKKAFKLPIRHAGMHSLWFMQVGMLEHDQTMDAIRLMDKYIMSVFAQREGIRGVRAQPRLVPAGRARPRQSQA